VEATTGKLRWRRAAEVYWYMSSPSYHDGKVFTGNSDARFVQALNTKDGSVAWAFDTKINVFSSPSVAAGVVYAGAWDGVMHALDESSGKELWSFTTLGRRIFSSVAVEGAHVYFGGDDGGIYALNVSPARSLARAVFYDATLDPMNDLPAAKQLRDYLAGRGYTVLDAAHLASYLADPANARGNSVIVFAMSALPNDVTDGRLRTYLDRGGKVVWCADPPTLWGSKPLEQRELSDLDRSKPKALIGVSFEQGNFDPMTATVTADGLPWGLSGSWLSNWSADPESVTTVLARDEQGLAAAWLRSYGGPPGTGFVKVPLVVSPQGTPLNAFAIDMAAQYRPT
jgi:hypothetical protein